MNCRRARQLVFEFVDGIEDERIRLELENHLAECGACEKLASQLVRSMDLLHRAPVEKLDENFNWNVRLAIHKERHAMRENLASQGALLKAWNLRYAASAVGGLVGVVAVGWMAISAGIISIGGGPGVQSPAVVAENVASQRDYAGKNATPSDPSRFREPDGAVFVDRSPGSVVSQGAPQPVRTTQNSRGAIEAATVPLDLDSLVQAEMQDQTPDERVRYLEERIQLLNGHLEQCKARKNE